MDINMPVLVLQVVWPVAKGVIGMVRKRISAAALAFLEALVALCTYRIAFWWSAMVSGVPSRRKSVRTAVHTLEVV